MKRIICLILALLIMIPIVALACKHGSNATCIRWDEDWQKSGKPKKIDNARHEQTYIKRGICTICEITNPTDAWQDPKTKKEKEFHYFEYKTKSRHNQYLDYVTYKPCACGATKNPGYVVHK